MIKSAIEIKTERITYQALEDEVMKYIENAIDNGDSSIMLAISNYQTNDNIDYLICELRKNYYVVNYDESKRMLNVWWQL